MSQIYFVDRWSAERTIVRQEFARQFDKKFVEKSSGVKK